jgi:gamma-glutamyltranspeptidase
LKSYECVLREPVSFKLKNNTEIFSVPAPGCGFMLNFILALMDSFEHVEYSLDVAETSALFYHRFIEACKYSFGFRCLIGDDSFDDSSSVSTQIHIHLFSHEGITKAVILFIPMIPYGSLLLRNE